MSLLANDNCIVMVDDNEDWLELAHDCYSMSALGQPWKQFNNGIEFLKYLDAVKSGLELAPASVLLDINMPEINGFDVLAQIRCDPAFEALPVVILSHSENPRDLARAHELGATAFRVKPDTLDGHVGLFNSLADPVLSDL